MKQHEAKKTKWCYMRQTDYSACRNKYNIITLKNGKTKFLF